MLSHRAVHDVLAGHVGLDLHQFFYDIDALIEDLLQNHALLVVVFELQCNREDGGTHHGVDDVEILNKPELGVNVIASEGLEELEDLCKALLCLLAQVAAVEANLHHLQENVKKLEHSHYLKC